MLIRLITLTPTEAHRREEARRLNNHLGEYGWRWKALRGSRRRWLTLLHWMDMVLLALVWIVGIAGFTALAWLGFAV